MQAEEENIIRKIITRISALWDVVASWIMNQ